MPYAAAPASALQASPEPVSYRIVDLPAVTGISRSAIYRAIASGALVKRSSGRIAFVLADDLRAWLTSFPTQKAA